MAQVPLALPSIGNNEHCPCLMHVVAFTLLYLRWLFVGIGCFSRSLWLFGPFPIPHVHDLSILMLAVFPHSAGLIVLLGDPKRVPFRGPYGNNCTNWLKCLEYRAKLKEYGTTDIHSLFDPLWPNRSSSYLFFCNGKNIDVDAIIIRSVLTMMRYRLGVLFLWVVRTASCLPSIVRCKFDCTSLRHPPPPYRSASLGAR